jgi:hypothetical protein
MTLEDASEALRQMIVFGRVAVSIKRIRSAELTLQLLDCKTELAPASGSTAPGIA